MPDLSGLPIPRRTRVRMEFTADPNPDRKAVAFVVDKKITALRILMTERFGANGTRAYEDWLLYLAADANRRGEVQ